MLQTLDRHAWVIDGALAGILLGLLGRGAGALDNAGLVLTVVAAAAATAFGIIPAESAYRRARAEERELDEQRRSTLRFVAKGVRELLLETSLYRDWDEFTAIRDAQLGNPGKHFPRTDWTVEGVIARGEAALDHAPLRALADSLRGMAEHTSGWAGPYDGSLDYGAQRALAKVLEVARKAAEEGDYAAMQLDQLRDRGPGATFEDRQRLEDAYRQARSLFYGALQWLVGCVEQLERAEGYAGGA